MRNATLAALGAATAVAAVPATVSAQTVPDLGELVTQSEQLNRGAEQAARARVRARGEEETAIDGEAGIYVLTVNQIFQIGASGTLGYTDNPQRTADDLGGSAFGEFSLNAGMATRLGGLVDFGLSVNVAGREFFADDAPSSRNLSASLSTGVTVIGPLYAGVVAFGGWSFDGAFKNGTAFYGVTANLSAAIPVSQRLVLRPGVGVTRQWAEVSENDSALLGASLDVIYAVTPSVTATLRGTLTRRWYDDFYEDVTFVARRDTPYGVTAALSWQPHRNISLAVTASWERQRSRFFLAQFDAFEGTAGLSLRLRF